MVNTGQSNNLVLGGPARINGPGSNVDLAVGGLNGSPPGIFTTLIFNRSRSRLLSLELTALQADGKGKIVSSPRVVTANQMEATIEQGTEVPYQQASSSGATTTAFKKAVLSLKVKPQITPDDNVIMTLRVNKDSVIPAVGNAIPSIDTKNITTEVLVESGGTVVIGGIYQQNESTATTKVPVLGDLPYVGFLFKNNAKTNNRSELLVFITPKILKDNMNLRQ